MADAGRSFLLPGFPLPLASATTKVSLERVRRRHSAAYLRSSAFIISHVVSSRPAQHTHITTHFLTPCHLVTVVLTAELRAIRTRLPAPGIGRRPLILTIVTEPLQPPSQGREAAAPPEIWRRGEQREAAVDAAVANWKSQLMRGRGRST